MHVTAKARRLPLVFGKAVEPRGLAVRVPLRVVKGIQIKNEEIIGTDVVGGQFDRIRTVLRRNTYWHSSGASRPPRSAAQPWAGLRVDWRVLVSAEQSIRLAQRILQQTAL